MLQFIVSLLLLNLLFTLTYAQNKVNIAVLELKGEGISSSEARIITSRLRTDLFNTNKFTVVEREVMNDILQEQGFQMSACTSNECVVEVGKLLGVRLMVAGDIGKIGNLFTISIRMIDVQNGKILKTATEDCECKIETVLIESVKNVAEILSGQKVEPHSYRNKSAENYDNINTNKTTKRKGVAIFKSFSIIAKGGFINPQKSFWKSGFSYGVAIQSINIENFVLRPSFIGYVSEGPEFEVGANTLQKIECRNSVIGIDVLYYFSENFENFYVGFGGSYNILAYDNASTESAHFLERYIEDYRFGFTGLLGYYFLFNKFSLVLEAKYNGFGGLAYSTIDDGYGNLTQLSISNVGYIEYSLGFGFRF